MQLPIRAVFYYPRFPQTWYADDHFHPVFGEYSSSNRVLVATHVKQMKHAGMQAAIGSRWDQGKQHEGIRFPILFRAAKAAKGFAIAPYYEPEGQVTDPSLAKVRNDLAYLEGYHARFPSSFLTVGGKPVIFVYNAHSPSRAEVSKWSDATDGFTTWYVSLKVFPGFEDCAEQPSSWHQYGTEWQSPSGNGRYLDLDAQGVQEGEALRPPSELMREDDEDGGTSSSWSARFTLAPR